MKIASPAAGATVSGTLSVTGNASDNVAVAKVEVAVDGGVFKSASGTTSWSFPVTTTAVANGSHTITARATDTSGNTASSSVAVTVGNASADTTPPTVSITSPASGSTVSGTVSVSGKASDNVSVAKVELAVDAGAFQSASGTINWSFSLTTSALANGSHTITARATDTSGNVASSSIAVTVGNASADTTPPTVSITSPAAGSTVSGTVFVTGNASDNVAVAKVEVAVDAGAFQTAGGTNSWSLSLNTDAYNDGPRTITVRATDSSGNASTASVSVTFNNTAPGAQHWVSPEGTAIDIDAGISWTVSQIYQILTQNASAPGDFATIAPTLSIKLTSTGMNYTSSVGTMTGSTYTSFSATVYLMATSGSTFDLYPDEVLGHEYGHVWTMYHLYMARQGDWSSYLNMRWSNSDGSLVLANDTRLDTSTMWDRHEIMAEDYRLLFGSAKAIAEDNAAMNWQIPDPRNVPGLASFFLNTWAVAK